MFISSKKSVDRWCKAIEKGWRQPFLENKPQTPEEKTMKEQNKDQADCLRKAAQCLIAAADTIGAKGIVQEAQREGLLRRAASLLVWRSGSDTYYAIQAEVEEVESEK